MKKLIITLILTSMLFGIFSVQGVSAADDKATLDIYSTNSGYLVMAEGAAIEGKDLIFYAGSFDEAGRLVGLESSEISD